MRRCLLFGVLFTVAASFSACGGGSPVAPNGAGVSVDGLLLGLPVAASSLHASAGSALAASEVTVTCVENPSITATVGPDGSFTLRGLPEGGFTLVFREGTTALGQISFSDVKPNQQITITVSVVGNTVTLVEEKRNGIGHGDLEIEGLVQQVLCGGTSGSACTTSGESRFVIDGYTVVFGPGQTTIREGNAARTVDDVTVGRRVHVKGTWLPVEQTVQPVLALEIKLQGDDDAGALSCIAASKVEVEGKIQQTNTTDTLLVFQQGKGLYECSVASNVPIRKGNTSYNFADLQPGWQVHVKGTAQGPAADGSCQVMASEVMVQRN